jgi:hypothetical protein
MNGYERLRKTIEFKEIIEWLDISISCFKDMCTLWKININKGTFEYNTASAKKYKTKQSKSLTRNTSKMPEQKENLADSALKIAQAWHKSVIWELLANCNSIISTCTMLRSGKDLWNNLSWSW